MKLLLTINRKTNNDIKMFDRQTCVNEQLNQLSIGHQELRNKIHIPIPDIS